MLAELLNRMEYCVLQLVCLSSGLKLLTLSSESYWGDVWKCFLAIAIDAIFRPRAGHTGVVASCLPPCLIRRAVARWC